MQRLLFIPEDDQIDTEGPSQFKSKGFSRDLLMFGGLEALWDTLNKGSDERESYVASHLRQALGNNLPSYIQSDEPTVALPPSMLPTRDRAIAKSMAKFGRMGQKFPYEENVTALNLPSIAENAEEVEIKSRESLQSWK